MAGSSFGLVSSELHPCSADSCLALAQEQSHDLSSPCVEVSISKTCFA